ncbi:hypothetical protein SLOPH_704 [Spraguea lophii 42_110]|uniref:Uncharacterized protein n=1 Tax=Spraguea lophii (strain 42_110) TaxID=1358809 RepID=S7WCY0_SPRLO|nr:hypothetical protein SLOPH_704 [Spraguea lophii 42_110]
MNYKIILILGITILSIGLIVGFLIMTFFPSSNKNKQNNTKKENTNNNCISKDEKENTFRNDNNIKIPKDENSQQSKSLDHENQEQPILHDNSHKSSNSNLRDSTWHLYAQCANEITDDNSDFTKSHDQKEMPSECQKIVDDFDNIIDEAINQNNIDKTPQIQHFKKRHDHKSNLYRSKSMTSIQRRIEKVKENKNRL